MATHKNERRVTVIILLSDNSQDGTFTFFFFLGSELILYRKGNKTRSKKPQRGVKKKQKLKQKQKNRHNWIPLKKILPPSPPLIYMRTNHDTP